MNAYDARLKLNKEKAKSSVKNFFPLIEKAISKLEDSFYIKAKDITQEEVDELFRLGYKYEKEDDDSGDYHKSGKIISYTFYF